MYEGFGDEGVQAWAIASREQESVVQAFVDFYDIEMPVLLDGDGAVAELYAGTLAFPTAPYPQEWIVGPDGRVVYYANELTIDEVVAVLEDALAQ